MSFSGSNAEEARARWAGLQNKWHACREEWRDEVAQRFENEHWTPWQASVPALLDRMAELESVIGEVESETRQLD